MDQYRCRGFTPDAGENLSDGCQVWEEVARNGMAVVGASLDELQDAAEVLVRRLG